MGAVRYQFAYDSNNTIVDINDVSKDSKHNNKYTCISCGEEMIAKLGDIKKHHFAHKNDCTCNGETYLHKLAKRLIKEKFDTSKEFKIEVFQQYKCCKHETCPSYDSKTCHSGTYKWYDLKKYYTKCKEEVIIKKDNTTIRADILLTKDEKTPPLMIEICVTHECTEEKKKLGYRIIEIPIKTEKDIQTILNEAWSTKTLKFMNFNDHTIIEEPLQNKKMNRFVLFQDDRFQLNDSDCSDEARMYSDSRLELIFFPKPSKRNYPSYNDSELFIKYGLSYAINKFVNFRKDNCIFCNHYRLRRCIISKESHTPPYPEWTIAEYCKYYTFDEHKPMEILEEKFLLNNYEVKEI